MATTTMAQFGVMQTNKIKTLAEFSKAAYAVQPWEAPGINDVSPGADEAYQSLLAQGWKTIDFNIPSSYKTFISSSTEFTVANKMDNGFYTYANAAALVARTDDALVIAFRGTNDSDKKGTHFNPHDPNDNFHPDEDHWTPVDLASSDSMTRHYKYYNALFGEVNRYLQAHTEIQKVFVTGHSLGGSMAIEYMSRMQDGALSVAFESVVFAAAPFTYTRNFLGLVHRKDYQDDSRILQIEIAEDPVAESWDALLDNNRPGEVVRLYGNKTLDTPDAYMTYTSRDANHSMDYYLEMARNIDPLAWQQIIAQLSIKSLVNVYLGGEQVGSEFIVAEQNDRLSASGFDLIYGGAGHDTLIGSDGQDTLMGGEGDDILNGKAGQDIIIAGSGADKIYVSGNDRVFGGEGLDTLFITGQHSQHSVDHNPSDDIYDMNLTGPEDTYSLRSIERLHFTDKKIAFDIEGNAGKTVKILGAVFGANSITNKEYVGIGLDLLDRGMSYGTLIDFALTASGALTNRAVVDLLYENVVGVSPSSSERAVYESLLEQGMSNVELGYIAAEHVLNIDNINLIGLAQEGVEYV